MIAIIGAAVLVVLAGVLVVVNRDTITGMFNSSGGSAQPAPAEVESEPAEPATRVEPETLRVFGTPPDGSAVAPLPAGAPPCPSGMTPVYWTRYADGSVLVCRDADTFGVVTATGWTPTELRFTDGGFEVAFDGGAAVSAELGGALVLVARDGQSAAYVASESWSLASGTATFAQAPTVRSCPPDTRPISLSTWENGWLMVCGTSPTAPESMLYSEGGNQAEAVGVTDIGGGYCGDGPSGRVCVYRSPAVVQLGGTQHSVADNYFAGAGHGGAGEGEGSYDVPAPEADATDQVRYLVDLLNKSRADRKALGPAAQNVLDCKNLGSAVREIESISKNRQDLLDALESTPVDLIPGGDRIVAELRAALAASRDADDAWADWGRAQQGYCASSRPQSVVDAQQVVDRAKTSFCSTWKREIVDVYGVKVFATEKACRDGL